MRDEEDFRLARIAGRVVGAASLALLLQGSGLPPQQLYDSDGTPTYDPTVPAVDATVLLSSADSAAFAAPQSDSYATVASSSVPATTVAGRTPATFAVPNSGAASYSIPLWTPPGVGAVQLSLALVYSSRSPDGVMGVGWGLSGQSAITRCNKTWAQDGAPAGVTNTLSDRFCLDGQQLKLTSAAGTYGQASSTYATEIESFSKIAASATLTGAGPTSFTVTSKNGLIYDYGTTVDSRVFAGTSGTIRTWALSAIRDRVGNAVSFVYYNDAQNGAYTTGSYRIKEVNYPTTVTGQGPFYKVAFGYSARPTTDVVSGFLGGYAVSEPNELDTVTIQTAAGVIIKTYNLAYQQGTATNRLRLATVTECSATNCFAPTTIAYQNGSQGWATSTTAIGQNIASASAVIPVDLNGDGITDLFFPIVNGANWSWSVRYGTGSGTFGGAIATGVTTVPNQRLIPGSFGGKGQVELLYPSGGYWWRLYWNGSALSAASTGAVIATTVGDSSDVVAADVDGDGLPDLVFSVNAGDVGVRAKLFVQRNITPPGGAVAFGAPTVAFNLPINTGPCAELPTCKTYFFDAQSSSPYYGEVITVADFNGDGRADLLVKIALQTRTQTTYNWTRLISNGTNFTQGTQSTSLVSSLNERLVDWNGDGCTDVADPGSSVGGTWNIILTDCGTGGGVGSVFSTGIANTQIVMTVDWDGDGRQDLVAANGTTWKALRSTGTGVAASQIDTGISVGSKAWVVGDFNGDGLSDLVASDQLSSNALSVTLHNGSGITPDLATTFTDGFGMTQSPVYDSIARSSYTKGSCGTDGTDAPFNGPLQVVSQVTASDGTGSNYTLQYGYTGACVNIQGRGFEGFSNQRTFDPRTNLATREYVSQRFPYAGMLAQRQVVQATASTDSTAVYSWTATLAKQTLGVAGFDQRTFPFVGSSTETRNEYPSGALITQTDTSNTYGDTFGNLTNAVTTVTDKDAASPYNGLAWVSTVTNTFNNDTPTNCFGLPATTQVQNQVPGQVTDSRNYSYSVDFSKCRVTSQVIEPSTTALTVTTSLRFDTCGNVQYVDVVGHNPDASVMPTRTTQFDYGTRCQLPETVTNALGQASTIGYDYSFGAPISIRDPNLLTTTWTLDDFGRKKLETHADATRTAWTYTTCNSGNSYCGQSATDLRFQTQTQFQDTAGGAVATSAVESDGFDRLRLGRSQHVLSGGAYTIDQQRVYDAVGRVIKVFQPSASISGTNGYWKHTYDALGRITARQLFQAGSAPTPDRTYTLGYAGRTTTATDPLNHAAKQVTDVMGRLRQVIDPGALAGCAPSGGGTCYDYDPFGHLNKTTDATNKVSTAAYNKRGFRTGMTDADAGAWTFEADSLNEPIHVRDAKTSAPAWTQTLGYDALGQLISRTEPEGTSCFNFGSTAASHNIGQLTSITWGASCAQTFESRVFDSVGRLQTRTITTDQAYAFDYAYRSDNGLLDTLTYPTSPIPSGGTGTRLKVQYAYSFGAPSQITDITDSPTTRVLWTLGSANDYASPVTETLGTASTTSVTSGYKAWTNELLSIQSGIGTGTQTNRQNLSFTWDTAGNLTQRSDLARGLTENFGYDALDRLTAVTGATTLTMTYDPAGNIQTKSDVSASAYTYAAAHPHAVATAGSSSFTYDANGNAITRNGSTITWASFNLPTLINSGTFSSTFAYGPDHHRIQQVAVGSDGTATTQYVGGLLEKLTPSTGAVQWRHFVLTPGNTEMVVSRNNDFTGSTTFVLTDHLGNSNALLDKNGALVVAESFTPFGARRNTTTWNGAPPAIPDMQSIANTTRDGFTGHEMVDNVGVIHMGGRVYDPVVGRFLSVDPLVGSMGDSQSVNPYAYVGNRTLNSTDPTGLEYGGSSCFATGVNTFACVAVASIADTVWNFLSAGLFGRHQSPPPPMSLPGSSAQSGWVICSTGSSSAACGGGTPALPCDFGFCPGFGSSSRGADEGVDSSTPFSKKDFAIGIYSGIFRDLFDAQEDRINEIRDPSLRALANSIVNTLLPIPKSPSGEFGYDVHVAVYLVGAIRGSGAVVGMERVVMRFGERTAARGAAQIGRAGEAAAGIIKNTERIASASGTAAYRVPDVLNHSARVIGEVKNVGSLSYTSQLRDFASYASSNKYTFELWVRPTTQLSGPLQQAVSSGEIVLRFLP